VCRVTGLTYRELDHAVRQGWLSASVPAEGGGTSRRYGRDDVRRARVYAVGRRLGLSATLSAQLAGQVLTGRRRFDLAPGVVLELDEQRLRPPT
jgi:hypothetical protein